MKKVGLWMYKNDGGDIIQERLKSKLIKNKQITNPTFAYKY